MGKGNNNQGTSSLKGSNRLGIFKGKQVRYALKKKGKPDNF